MRPWPRVLGALLLLAMCAVLRPAGAAEESPVTGAERILGELQRQGKDVSALRAELDALRPEWSEIEKERDALQARVAQFAPKMQALMQRMHGAGGQPESPIAGVEQALKQLAAAGKDVRTLGAELDRLRPEWAEIASLQAQLPSVPAGQRAQLENRLRAKVDAFRPRLEALAQRVQALAHAR